MKVVFRHYFRPINDELAELWSNALFSFDASVLLNLYGYTEKTRDALVGFAEQYAERLRLPYQFGLEYVRNRRNVIQQQINKYKSVQRKFEEMKQDIVSTKEHPYLSDKCMKAYGEIQDELERRRAEIARLLESDPHGEKIVALFEERVSKRPSHEEALKMEKDAQLRYEKRIPPGYMDVKEKGISGAYGDYFGWRQLMDIAKAEQHGIIFVIDDLKQDWWWDTDRTLPRPELLVEFMEDTQQQIYMYTSETFLTAARQFTAADIAEDAIEEVRRHLASVREGQTTAGLKPLAAEDAKTATPASVDKPSGPLMDKPTDGDGPETGKEGEGKPGT